jgi:hypothetical protein
VEIIPNNLGGPSVITRVDTMKDRRGRIRIRRMLCGDTSNTHSSLEDGREAGIRNVAAGKGRGLVSSPDAPPRGMQPC